MNRSRGTPAVLLAAAVLVCAVAVRAGAATLDLGSTGDQVRVVIDTSKSMCGAACGWQDPPNDPGRLSILSTLLLHDLLKPNPSKAENPDSFAVIPFDNQPWTEVRPPVSRVTPRRAQGMAARAPFIAELGPTALPFDVMNTYYAPNIERALDDLGPPNPATSQTTTRTIVLITDGRSVRPEADAAYLQETLLPRLAATQTRLYVIMFGPDAQVYGAPFFAAIERADAANVRSGVYAQRAFPRPAFLIPSGRDLPGTMIALFSEAFGYQHVPADDFRDKVGTAPVGLNLNRDMAPTEAAIVALRLDPVRLASPAPPRLTLLPPPGGSVNQQQLLTAGVPGGSYALRWELTPSPGRYPLRIEDGGDDLVFVLRPTNLKVYLREHMDPNGTAAGTVSCLDPAAAAQGTFMTMANTECRLDFLIASATGTAGLPPKLKLRYWIRQPRPNGSGAWDLSDAGGNGIPDGQHWDDAAAPGRRYWTSTLFPANQIPWAGDERYTAQVTVEVGLGDKTVAQRGARDPFEVLVYPELAITPDPPAANLQTPAGALAGGESACTDFVLTERPGTSLESAKGSPGFHVQAFVEADRQALEGPLRDAVFTLDGESIAPPGTPGHRTADWSRGRGRTAAELVQRLGAGGAHRFCVTLGPYANGDPAAPPAIAVRFILRHAPYDHFDVIRPFRARALVAPAAGLDGWSLLPFLLLALGLLLAPWLLRPGRALPRDLGYATAPLADPGRFTPRPLPHPHPLRWLLSPRAGRAVTDGRGALLGWITPRDEDLYALRPAAGVRLVDDAGAPLAPAGGGACLVEVRRSYRLDYGEEGLWFRVQFL
jgi:hypothetical protein